MLLLKLDDRAVQKVLGKVSFHSRDIAIALKGKKKNVQERIFRNMSERAAQMLREDMEYMGPVRKSDVEERQKEIVDMIRFLEETGEIVINSKGGTIE
jgi:flagellar motor switch protein FliG